MFARRKNFGGLPKTYGTSSAAALNQRGMGRVGSGNFRQVGGLGSAMAAGGPGSTHAVVLGGNVSRSRSPVGVVNGLS